MLNLKICGLTNSTNIEQVTQLKPDMIGLIFFEGSQRNLLHKNINVISLSKSIKKVGVFVDLGLEEITAIIEKYDLDFIQLYHSDIIPFQKLRPRVKIIKALNIGDKKDLEQTAHYKNLTDYFLFDAKGDRHGGNGIKFDWLILNDYKGSIPFILSGGINSNDSEVILKINLPTFYGIDINSKFEISPGIKSIELIKTFKHNLESYGNIKHH